MKHCSSKAVRKRGTTLTMEHILWPGTIPLNVRKLPDHREEKRGHVNVIPSPLQYMVLFLLGTGALVMAKWLGSSLLADDHT